MKRNSLVLVLVLAIVLAAFAVGMVAGQSSVPCALVAGVGDEYIYYSYTYSPNKRWLTCKYEKTGWYPPARK